MKTFLLIALGLLAGASQTVRADDTIERGRYLSVDTGKFSTAPWTAQALADSLA